VSKRHGRRGPGPGPGPVGSGSGAGSESGAAPAAEGSAPRAQHSGRPQGQRPQGPRHGGGERHGQGQGQGALQQNKGANWVQVRDAVRRDLEVGLQSLSFLERFGEGLDSQRRLFVDFPRVTEELRTGAMERLASAMEHLYEGEQGSLDLARFLRDLPLALGHLAQAEFAAHRQKQQQAAAAAKRATESANATAPDAEASADGTTSEIPDQVGDATSAGEAVEASGAADESSGAATGAAENDSGAATAAAETEAVKAPEAEAAKPDISPRVELRTRLLAAAPNLGKAAQAFRRNSGTVRRAAAPRRAVGPWRSDKEVLDQARRAIEFANKVYDAYAEAWNDAPLAKNAGPEAAAEMDRFLAWTQLSRYGEVARTQVTGAKTHEAAPGVKTEKQSHSQPPSPKQEAPSTQTSEAAPAETAIAAPDETTTAAPAGTTTAAP
jgi:hypothetical protein